MISRLLAMPPRAFQSDLTNMATLLDAFEHPETSFPSIHIAGSNGKGSVSTKIAKGLELAGYKVGLYTSPHLFSFCERITISSQPISEEEAAKRLEKIFCVAKHTPSTFFELMTLLAFDYFRSEKIDVAVIETGLGGRLDATNLITPLLSIITSISLEHVDILGNTREAIAKEKAGIIKPKVPILIGPKAKCQAIYAEAIEQKSPLYEVNGRQRFYDEENQAIAKEAMRLLSPHFFLPLEALEKGLQARPLCRFDKREDVIFDVAHNFDGFKRLFEALHLFYPSKRLHLVLGMSKDKDLEACLSLIKAHAEHIHLVEAPSTRAASCEMLADLLLKQNYSRFSYGATIQQSVRHAKTLAKEGLVVVCGSFFIMQEAMAFG